MNAIIQGSLGAIAQQNGQSIAESFLNAEVIVIVDTSGSMSTPDSRGNRSRYDVACEELTGLQKEIPGKIAVLSFSDTTVFCPNGIPINQGAGTDLSGALKFARIADVDTMRFIVVSDGEPDDAPAALREAAKYKNKIDVIYVGSERNPQGRAFLEQLAEASGGKIITADKAVGLLNAVTTLLLDKGKE